MTRITLDDLTCIVVTFNSRHCVPALAKGLAELPHVVVVDNASDDGTAEAVRAHLPQALVLVNKCNRGFGSANNAALARVQTRYALLLNPDCLPDRAFFERLLEAAEAHSDAAMLAPHLMRRNGSPDVSYRWPASEWVSKGPKADGPCCVGFACGAALLLNMAVMRRVGFFDENFFLYYEDEDLCQRVFLAREQILLIPSVELVHLSRRSVKGHSPLRSEYLRGYHHAQSKILFERKYFGEFSANSLRLRTLAMAILTLVPRLLLPHPRYLARLVGRTAGLVQMKATRPSDADSLDIS